MHRLLSEPHQRGVDTAAHDVQNVLDARLPGGRQTPQVGPPDHHRAGAQRQCLDDIAAPTDTAVQQHLDIVSDGFGDAGQRTDGRRGAIEVVTPVVRYRNRRDSAIHSTFGVIDAHHALEHEWTVPLLAHPAHVIPRGRRGPHPLPIGVEERWTGLAAGRLVGHP
ncbi:Uncharacterised protein [Mycobacteroides abscessus subsp. massiliense]|nr:Uncharacterised protein [Mycobacteroides abscessus subsp. massiliense]